MRIVRKHRLGVPQQSREAFTMLEKAGILDNTLSEHMQAMVGFRNIAVHDYQQLSLDIVRSILEFRLGDFRYLVKVLLVQAQGERTDG